MATDYGKVLSDLQEEFQDGEAQFQTWSDRREKLLTAIEALKVLLGAAPGVEREAKQPVPRGEVGLSSVAGDRDLAAIAPLKGNPHNLNYRQAVNHVFKALGRPLAPFEVADLLFQVGFAEPRSKVKNNVDGTMRVLRQSGAIAKVDGGNKYARMDGFGPMFGD